MTATRRKHVLVAATWVNLPDHDTAIPHKVMFTVPETAVWLGFMPYGEKPGSLVYRKATQRVRRMVGRCELFPTRVVGERSYLISGQALREYMSGSDEPIVAKESA